MKLYTQNGRWVGTQAEAKREFGEVNLVDVPTDKQALLDWLNEHNVGGSGCAPDQPMRWKIERDADGGAHMSPAPQGNITKPHAWQTIRECAEQADLKDLGVALAVLMNRLDEAADNVRH